MSIACRAILSVLMTIAILGPANRATIHDAAAKGDLAAVKALVAADPSVADAEKLPNKKTPLHYAVENGHAEVAAFLLDHGAQVNRPNIAGETALHYAVGLADPSVINLLLARGADVNARSDDGMTPLTRATAWGHVAAIKALLGKGADARAVLANGQTLLHVAALAGQPEAIALFADKGVELDAAAKNGETALFAACRAGNGETAAALLARGADPNRRDGTGRQPLEGAVNTGQAALVKRLLAAGGRPAEPAAADKRSALHFAAARGWLDITKMLLAAGADPSARDAQGRTPLDLASRHGNRLVADALDATAARPRSAGAANALEAAGRPGPGEATVWFLGHMGWAVRTAHHLLIFDVDGRNVPPDEPSLANGSIDPREIAGVATTVFITHGHDDHYAPGVFEWKKTVKDITYVAGFEPEGKEGYVLMGPRETKTLGGLEITTIKAVDEGVGFFVKVDGVTLFHSGDHLEVPGRDDFKPEIDFLAGRGLAADLLFMPVSMPHFPGMNEGVHYAMKRLSAREMFPGHLRGREQECGVFASGAAKAGIATPVHCPEFGGDRFTVGAGRQPGKDTWLVLNARDGSSQAVAQDQRLGSTIGVIGPRVNRCRVRLPASQTPGKAYPLVVGLHGNGGNADDIMRGLTPEAFPGMICAAPDGPYPREDLAGQPGAHYGWFVLTPDKALWRTLDAATSDYILAVVDEVSKGCSVSKVVLLGFSQGVSAAYLAALRRPGRIAGVVAFAGKFPEEEVTPEEIRAGSQIRVLIGHGTADRNVDLAESARARDLLRGAGYEVRFLTFDGGHEVPASLLRLTGEWIRGWI